jgi:hypothetical protein
MCGNGSWHTYGMRSILPLELGVTIFYKTVQTYSNENLFFKYGNALQILRYRI